MIGVDTNILLRLLTQDDLAQMERATVFLEQRCTPERKGYINLVVLAELVWTLETAYKFARRDVANAVLGLLDADALEVQQASAVRAACTAYLASPENQRRVGLADHLILSLNRAVGCETTGTMDRRLAEMAGVDSV